MARLHPDLRSTVDHEVEQLGNHDFVRKVPAAGNGRGGGGRSGGRGGRGGENVKCCYGCGEPGHFVRDCPVSGSHPRGYGRRGSQAYGNGDPSKVDVVEASCGDGKMRTKLVIMPKEFQTVSEPAKPFFDELALKNIEISSLLSKIDQKEKELDLSCQENKGLKSQLEEAISEISSVRAEKEGMSLKISQLEEELKKYKNNLSSAKDKEVEMTWKWCFLKNEFEDTKAQLKEVKEANEAAEADMKKLKLEIEQWRKAAKAAAAVFVGCADVCSKTSELESLVLYYNNRAVKRISLGKIGKALDDCKMAARLDTDFLKVCLTAGHCHLVLGEVDDAMYNYNKCLESGMVCLDRRLRIEASDGLQKAQKVLNCINQSAELLQQKTIDAASTAMETIVEALSISYYSEKLLEMKGEALFMLRQYEEVIQMCEQTLEFAEKNVSTFGVASHVSDADGKRSLKRWRWNLMSRSYFYLGRLDTALAIIEKQEPLKLTEDKIEGSPTSLAFTVRELLRSKSDGNEAYKSGRHTEALKHYSNALSRSIDSRPFTAVCLCNRAAAHQALGEVIDAIADCNLAIALDGSYLKAISRRANLHEKIRDYEHAAHDLQSLISLLEKRSVEKSLQSGTADAEDIRSARRRLSSTENKAKKGMPLDLYLILGLKGSDSASEIKKAYHKAALRHHPDKAGKFLTRSESRDDGQVWKEIVTIIQKDADRLFKMIGEAYAVLSDANKRFKYNLEDSMWDD